MDVLTPKEKAHFAQNIKADPGSAAAKPFEAWSENHTLEEIQLAMAEINDYIADQERQLDEAAAYQRDTVRQKRDMAKQHLQAQLEFVNYHPEFINGEPYATILSTRVCQLMLAGGLDPKETPFTLEMLEQAFRELVNESRIDWNPAKGSPWARVEYKRNSEPGPAAPEPLTEDEIDQQLDSGLLSREELEQAANDQLAAQNNGEVEHVVPERSVVVGRVVRPEPTVPTSRDRGFAADLFVARLNPDGPDRR